MTRYEIVGVEGAPSLLVATNKLEERINARLQDGWHLVGGISISQSIHHQSHYGMTVNVAQAMARDES